VALSIRSDSEGALCARLVSSFPSSRWEDSQSVHLCCFGGAVTRLLEHLRVRPYQIPWVASRITGSPLGSPSRLAPERCRSAATS
jgi:hypothetical protein